MSMHSKLSTVRTETVSSFENTERAILIDLIAVKIIVIRSVLTSAIVIIKLVILFLQDYIHINDGGWACFKYISLS